MPAIEVRVLGPIDVVGEDGSIPLAGKQARLLAALVVAGGRACGIDELVEAVWDGSAPPSARKLVQVYISQLRKALPELQLVTRGGAYALELDREGLDAARFEGLLDECRSTRRDGNPALTVSLAERALALWRGRAYGELAYEEPWRAESDRLEELQLVAREERLDAQLALGRHEEILGEALALAEASPFRERVHELAMLALYRCGRQTDALDHFAAAHARLRDELGLEPGPALRDLQRRILQHDPELDLARGGGRMPSSLPAPPNPLIGRERELGELQALLERRDARLVVLTGAGGTGKTRLALEAARRLESGYANGVLLVELASIQDAALVPSTLAHALGVPESADQDPALALSVSLAPLELLVVLDNAEHLREAAPLYTELLRRAPRLTMLITSRAVLHVRGERVFPVAPLAEDAALELFVQRARLLRPDFELTEADEHDVREICRRVDGLPLAIELAAARVRTLPPRVVLDRLGARLGFLTGGPRDLPARQQTLRETIEWSVGLLKEPDRRAFARLGVFVGPWSLDAAAEICGVCLDELSTLVDDSLVLAVHEPGDLRFTMLETVRDLAREHLGADDECEDVRRRHATYYVSLAEEAEEALAGAEQARWLNRLEAEHDELRSALAWLAGHGPSGAELRLAAALGRFRYIRGYLVEGRSTLESALERGSDEPPALRAKAYRVGSALDVLLGDYERALALARTGLELYGEADDRLGVARSLSNVGAILVALGRPQEAAEALDEAVALARALGDERALALSLNNRGDVALTLGDWETASGRFAESLELLRSVGDDVNIARSLFNLGVVALERGDEAAARQYVAESVERCYVLDDKEDIAWCLVAFAALYERGGDVRLGARLLGAADRLLAGMGATLKPYEQALHSRVESAARAALGSERFDALREEGAGLSVADAVALAVADEAARG